MRSFFRGEGRSVLPSIFFATASIVGAGSIWAATPSKLDAALNLFAGQPAVAHKIYQERVQTAHGLEKASGGGRLSVLIRIDEMADLGSTLAALRAEGAILHSQLGPILTADVPIASVGALSDLDAVTLIELARPIPARLNVSVPATGASTLRTGTAPNWSGLTGKGVIVGIIDDGLDFRHLDFRKPDGSTRLLALWDQRAAGAAGQPPAGFTYGGECTPAMIAAAIGGDATACTQPSTGGHGTHVGGIAAGNGQGTGNAQAAYRFVGMAPEADILAANSIGGGVTGNGVLDAITWMKAKAAAAGKPLVINLSLGSYYGARDGSSNYEVALSSAGAAGVILVGAAGNEGNAPIRGEAPISQGGQVVFDLDVPMSRTSVRLETWYPGADSYAITVKGPGATCVATPFVGGVDNAVETPCGLIGVANGGPFTTNDDRSVEVTLRSGASALATGAWKVTFTGTTVTTPNTPLSIVTAETGGDLTITAINGQPFTGRTTKILTDTVTARREIGVAAYVTNYNWTSLNGTASPGTPDSGPVDDLANFSSRGPRRMCSNATKCPAVMKPEITAPGAVIMSTLARDKPGGGAGDVTTERDGVHVGENGTSMATPHVSGAVALLLQKKPTLTPEEVKQLLFVNIKKTPLTPAVPTYTGADVPPAPNFEWGYGVLDVAKAAAAIPTGGTLTVTVTKAGSGSGSVASTPGGIACGAACNQSFAPGTAVSLAAAADPGAVFTGWLGACVGTSTCDLTVTAATNVSATFAPGTTIPKTDVDGNNQYGALSDGLMILRYMFGLTGAPLTANAADPNGSRTNPADVAQHLANIKPLLDVDGNGQTDALTDGLMLIRYMFGLRGNSLISNAVGTGARRTTAQQIEPYILSILQ